MSSRYDFDQPKRRGRGKLWAGVILGAAGVCTAAFAVASYQNAKIGINSFDRALNSCRSENWIRCGTVPGAALGHGAAVLFRQDRPAAERQEKESPQAKPTRP